MKDKQEHLRLHLITPHQLFSKSYGKDAADCIADPSATLSRPFHWRLNGVEKWSSVAMRKATLTSMYLGFNVP